MSVKVRLIGIFQVLSGRNLVTVTLEEGATIREVIQRLIASFPPEFGETLVDAVFDKSWPNAMILVSGKEIGVLNGVETMIRDGDEVVFIPATHGG